MSRGLILGSVLFRVFINDLPSKVQHLGVILYAYNRTQVINNNYPVLIRLQLNEDLNDMYKWFIVNNLSLNVN